MKKFLLIIAALLAVSVQDGSARKVSRSRITSVISECSKYEGAETIRLGGLATGAVKGIVRLAAIADPDARTALQLMKGVKALSVFTYDDCSEADKKKITRKLDRALSGTDVLIEAKDDGEKMRIYGIADDDKVRDFVLYTPSDCTIICIFGSVAMESIKKLMDD